MINNGIEEIQPAVDFPVQFNFGSPYSSSLTVFFDFEESREIVADMSRTGKKLKRKEISGKVLQWVCNFLTSRVQQARVGSKLSREVPLRSGLPQGSVLGLLLFLIFISDLEKHLKSSIVEVLKYVDDSKLIFDVGSPEDVEEAQ